MNNRPPKDLKVVLLGAQGTGKTSAFNRYLYEEFGKTSSTIGAYFAMKDIQTRDDHVRMAIWDTSGNEKFESLSNFYVRNAQCVIIFIDPTQDLNSVRIQKDCDRIRLEAEKSCVISIAVTKLDVIQNNPSARRVSQKEIEEIRDQNGKDTPIHCISAKTGEGIQELFESSAKRAYLTLTPMSSSSKPEQQPLPLTEANAAAPLSKYSRAFGWKHHRARATAVFDAVSWAISNKDYNLAKAIIKLQLDWLALTDKKNVSANAITDNHGGFTTQFFASKHNRYLFKPSTRDDSQRIKENNKPGFYQALCAVDENLNKLSR
jgi:small GTP-binding protein